MSTTHHPTDETLAMFLDGSLDEARRVVIAAHVELCASCRRLASAIDTLGGQHLEQLPPASLSEGALEQLLSRLDEPLPDVHTGSAANDLDLSVAVNALAPYELGPWRWIGPGVRWRAVNLPSAANGSRLFLLKAAPGTHLPHHAHVGTELTVILKGAFRHAGGRFGIGDCDDADETVEHLPVVEDGEECVCLVAMQGHIRLLSFVGRLIQPFVRM
jgi:putative transcriptional regulator